MAVREVAVVAPRVVVVAAVAVVQLRPPVVAGLKCERGTLRHEAVPDGIADAPTFQNKREKMLASYFKKLVNVRLRESGIGVGGGNDVHD